MTRDRLRVAAATAVVALLGSAAANVWVVTDGGRRPVAFAVIASLVAVAAAVVVGVLLAAVLDDLEDLRRFLARPEGGADALSEDLRAASEPVVERVERLAALAAQLEALAVRDADTGVLTDREIDHRLLAEVDRVRRHGGEVSVLRIAIDGLDAVVEEHGPAGAAELLRGVAVVLETTARPSDIIGRMDDGFVVILPHAASEGAIAAGQRFVRVATATPMVTDLAGTVHVRVRAGVATFPREASTPGDLLVAAREGVERARREDRDVVRARG